MAYYKSATKSCIVMNKLNVPRDIVELIKSFAYTEIEKYVKQYKKNVLTPISTMWEDMDEDLREECIKYLTGDVLGLAELFDKINDEIFDKFGVNIHSRFSTSQLTYEIFLNYRVLPHLILCQFSIFFYLIF